MRISLLLAAIATFSLTLSPLAAHSSCGSMHSTQDYQPPATTTPSPATSSAESESDPEPEEDAELEDSAVENEGEDADPVDSDSEEPSETSNRNVFQRLWHQVSGQP